MYHGNFFEEGTQNWVVLLIQRDRTGVVEEYPCMLRRCVIEWESMDLRVDHTREHLGKDKSKENYN